MFKYPVLFLLSICLILKISTALTGLKGGLQPISVEDIGVKRVAEAAVKRISNRNKGERALILVEIQDAKSQVVAGIKYALQLKVGETNCPKGQFTSRCELDQSRPYLVCWVDAWDRMWLRRLDIEHHCYNYDSESKE